LPLIAPGILAGAVMGFAKAMGEFGATITFVANIPGQTQTLPSAIWSALQIPGGENQAVVMVLMACAVAVSAVLLAEVLARRVAARISGA
jgi:molybdate transport system permease protein